ncbi:lipopolysaccharide biosynthesis protein [Shimia sp. FJ5]|uniref:lipopolysaccharide biosynthesis protein n=1 Tax=Shimia sp. FJ5 TaxID=3079054 RepID=UPI002610A58F|nr:oligosaccharide flippase family protein [Shimia sp. FJ5]MDV4144319.1 oligosaccharide flippase family protein [Shimia sp. FJ5]
MSVLKTYRPGALSALFSQGASALGGFLAFLFLANMLSKDDFGAYSFAFNVMILFSILATLGFDRTLLLHLSRDGDPRQPMRGSGLLLRTLGGSALASVGFMALIWGVSTPLAQAMQSEVVQWWLAALAPVVLPMAALLLLRAWFQANHRFAIAAAMPGVADFLRAMLIGVAFVAATGKIGVALAVVAAFTFPMVALMLGARNAQRSSGYRLTREDLSRGIIYAFQRITEAGQNLFDVIIIGLVASDATTAEFALAARLAVLTDIGRQAVHPTFLPRARLHLTTGDQTKIRSEYDWVRFLSLLGALAVAVFMLMFGPMILMLFGGYEAAFGPLVLMVGGYVVTAAGGPHLGFLTMTGEVRLPALIRVGGVVLTAIGIVIAVPQIGALGAGFAILLALIAVNIAALAALWWMTGFNGVSLRVLGFALVAVLTLCAVALDWMAPIFGGMVVVVVGLCLAESELAGLRMALRRLRSRRGGV